MCFPANFRLNIHKLSKKISLVSSKQLEPDFFWAQSFCEESHNVELSSNVKIQKIIKTGSRDVDKNPESTPKMGFFSYLWPHKNFFINRALSLLNPYGALISCEKLMKSLVRYLKTDQCTILEGLEVLSSKPGSKMRYFYLLWDPLQDV